jgi:sugar phosphate isomerase/epimerase
VALQLYTVRVPAVADLVGVVRTVGELGYDGVETAGLHGVEPAVVRETCAAAALEVCAAHVGLERFELEPDAVARELATLGTDRLVFPALPGDGGPTSIERLGRAAHVARGLGLRAAFHNHERELRAGADGARLWEHIVALPELDLELDLGWAWVAGASPAELLLEHAARVPLVHVKDHLADGVDCVVGEGLVGYDGLLPLAARLGVDWIVVEQDEPGADPLTAAGRSLVATRRLLADGAAVD